MKKSLLLSAVACIAISASATVTDITPSGYIFNNVSEFSYGATPYATANPAAPVWGTVKGDENYNNGLVALGGGAAQFGPTVMTGWNTVSAGTSLLNLGGEVGQVLCINGANSNLSTALKNTYDVDLTIPKMTTQPAWFAVNFFSDPNNTPKCTSTKYRNVRCRITFNIYHNAIPENGELIVTAYLVNNQNDNTMVAATDEITTEACIKYDEYGDPEVDDNDNSVWDPTKWLVFEKNIAVAADEDGKTYAPVRLKFDVKPGIVHSGAFLIKSVEYFSVTEDDAVESADAVKSYVTLTPNPAAVSGISNVAADTTVNYSINGNAVTFGENATIYAISGAQVATAIAGQAVELNAGFYVANAGGKAVKFAIK